MTAITQSTSEFPRRVLLGNAIFSTISGLIMIVDAGPLSAFTGIEPPIVLRIVGIGLLLFAGSVWTAARQPVKAHELLMIAILDTVWVLGSIALLVGGWLPLTTAGQWTVGVIADLVATFAVLQFVVLWRMKRSE
jgi:hypothetical protein